MGDVLFKFDHIWYYYCFKLYEAIYIIHVIGMDILSRYYSHS